MLQTHGFPGDKRLGAGVVDGRSVWADGDAPAALLAAIVAQVCLWASLRGTTQGEQSGAAHSWQKCRPLALQIECRRACTKLRPMTACCDDCARAVM